MERSELTDYIVSHAKTHTSLQTLLAQGHSRTMGYMGIFVHTKCNESRTMLRLEMDKCVTCWADRQDHMGMGQHYVNPRAALCT